MITSYLINYSAKDDYTVIKFILKEKSIRIVLYDIVAGTVL